MTVRPMTGGRCRASPVTSQHLSVVGRTSSHHDDQPLPKLTKSTKSPRGRLSVFSFRLHTLLYIFENAICCLILLHLDIETTFGTSVTPPWHLSVGGCISLRLMTRLGKLSQTRELHELM